MNDPQPVQAGAELLPRLRKMSTCVYLATEASVADDISDGLEQAIARIEALEAATDELTRLREKVGRMENGLKSARVWFRDYERQHRAKRTTDGELKADVNADRAAYVEAALADQPK